MVTFSFIYFFNSSFLFWWPNMCLMILLMMMLYVFSISNLSLLTLLLSLEGLSLINIMVLCSSSTVFPFSMTITFLAFAVGEASLGIGVLLNFYRNYNSTKLNSN